MRQMESDTGSGAGEPTGRPGGDSDEPGEGKTGGDDTGATPRQPTRYHGTVALDPGRVGRDAGQVADEVISHLSGLVGAEVVVTLEIQVIVPNGAPDQVVRTVTENGKTLKFTSQGFEDE